MMSTPHPLTHAQESLYFLQQLTRGEPVYNMPQAFRLRGSLDIAALEKALRSVFRRHDALRMRIVEGPKQMAAASEEVCFRIHDGCGETLHRAVREPFDLETGPIFRADLFRVRSDEHVLLLNLHHIVGDMASLGIIFDELAQVYAGRSLSGAPLQLGAYASQRREKQTSPEILQFWRENLQDYTSELQLPLDRFRPKYPSFRGDAYYSDLAPDLRIALSDLARRNKSSLYMVCLAAVQSLLYHYTGQERFAIATPFTDRDDPKLEHTVGYLVNLLPIACEVRPELSFRELLARVRAQCLQAYGNHEISFRRIVQELGIASENPKPPLARVVFQYFQEIASLRLPGLDCEPVRVHSGTSKFDLSVSMWEHEGRITTEFEYDTDIFNAGSIQRFARHFTNLLQAVVKTPDDKVGRLNLLDAEECRQLQEWSGAQVPYPRDKTVHQLFEEQVAVRPQAIALRFEDRDISYEALNQWANAIAEQLLGAGVKAGEFVGVCLERSPELIAALIGILKIGAAFVPFEASYPRNRLNYMFEDSGVRVLVTNSKSAHIAPQGIKVIFLNGETPISVGLNNVSTVNAESVAYMMYTSGSTGNPKGAIIPHRAIVRLVKNNEFSRFASDEVFLAFAPVSFDASTLEIWGALLNGATLAIYPRTFDSVDQFGEVLKHHAVTTLWLTAGLFNTFVDRNVQALRGVRRLLVGGDVLSVAHIQKALAALPNTEIINGYGPTENTTFTCCYPIPRDFPCNRSIPIGRPIKNTTVFILDERLEPTPIGVPGELYTGGDGLSLGYWKQPDLTATSFISHRFGRLYRTGDRARFLEDGVIEFLGRRDAQVKIRGFRIEMEEVEAVFRTLTAVQDVAVAAHSDNSGGKSLIAYVVPKNGLTRSLSDFETEVARLLPAHACPSRVVYLPELPLGPNGKVNRSALPKPAHLPTVSEREIARPTNATEETLVQLWQQILEVPALSIDDNFFHMGGESLRATRAVSQMNAAFNCRLTLPRLFEAPTVRQMARLVETDQAVETPIRHRITPVAREVPDVSKLSEQDVDSLLAQLLSEDASAKQ